MKSDEQRVKDLYRRGSITEDQMYDMIYRIREKSMGTNFYCRHIMTEQEWKEIQEKVDSKDAQSIADYIAEHTKEYHIGKRSGGWQFLFSPHKGFDDPEEYPWENNLQSVKDYLYRPDIDIYNEYGQHFTADQFFNEEIKEYIGNGLTLRTYYEKEGRSEYSDPHSEIERDGVRFADTCNFS